MLIMHVDDEPDIRELTRLSLEMMGGFDVVQFASGVEAVEAAASHRPDLVLLDVMMPELDGTETFRRLRALEAYRDIPIAFMTAKASVNDQKELLALGAITVIAKPFDPMTLPDIVRSLLNT